MKLLQICKIIMFFFYDTQKEFVSVMNLGEGVALNEGKHD